MRRASEFIVGVAIVLGVSLGCSRGETTAHAEPLPLGPPPPAPAPPAASAPTVDAAQPTNPPFTKKYRLVLHTGDSMVGGGLSRALRPLFATEGSKYVRDVWESGSIENFADAERLPGLIKRHDPDLILLSIGANDVGGNITDYLAKKIDKVVAMTQKGGPRDCIWIGPPKWRINGKPVVDMIRAHAGACVFFDGTEIVMERKEDKVHPNEHGGEQWATAFWKFFRGTDSLPPGPNGGPIFPLPVP